jgi:cobalamin biosynthesis protein CobT
LAGALGLGADVPVADVEPDEDEEEEDEDEEEEDEDEEEEEEEEEEEAGAEGDDEEPSTGFKTVAIKASISEKGSFSNRRTQIPSRSITNFAAKFHVTSPGKHCFNHVYTG